MPIQDFLARMDAFVKEVKSSKTRPGFEAVLVPGEIDHIREIEYRNSGAKLDKVVYDELRDLAETLNIDFPFKG
jgi:LDH2 family malate/lactate/ureidoglycolate dehydrogenase